MSVGLRKPVYRVRLRKKVYRIGKTPRAMNPKAQGLMNSSPHLRFRRSRVPSLKRPTLRGFTDVAAAVIALLLRRDAKAESHNSVLIVEGTDVRSPRRLRGRRRSALELVKR